MLYRIVTYGCQMNVHESEKLAGILELRGFLPAERDSDADVIVINTCCIRENAENRILGNLGFVKKLKEENRNLIVAVCGCMAQQDGAAERLKARCPFINIIFGTHNLAEFGAYLDKAMAGKKVSEVWPQEGEPAEGLPVKRGEGVNAWVNIMYGCDNFCTYCVVPYVRGRERSRKSELVLDDIKRLLDEGFKEITLLGQNVNSYSGTDADGNYVNFASLLEQAANVSAQKYRVRFTTSHPKDFSDEVIRVISDSPNVPEFIHLPAQSGSDRILKAMNRKYTAADYLGRIDAIKKLMPDAGISGDIMVGFPGETEEDFLDTLRLVESVRYINLFTFIYSKRRGTVAASMDNQIDRITALGRFQRLVNLQTSIGLELAAAAVGKTLEVLCDAYTAKTRLSRGKTASGKIIWFKSDTELTGQFVNVNVTHVKNSNLYGELI
ncbi:MAG: tRNA (N6-isopentenyl adenosine(37)-C2)-methylthiotransferase MiaB [Firmicutes bacterium]|nr:tRNA (N6-isopentenyl adenosine(37)-C2)-methylthiotransferase MiaB [Bacillota bacterium]